MCVVFGRFLCVSTLPVGMFVYKFVFMHFRLSIRVYVCVRLSINALATGYRCSSSIVLILSIFNDR